jgi:hypothetical protein
VLVELSALQKLILYSYILCTLKPQLTTEEEQSLILYYSNKVSYRVSIVRTKNEYFFITLDLKRPSFSYENLLAYQLCLRAKQILYVCQGRHAYHKFDVSGEGPSIDTTGQNLEDYHLVTICPETRNILRLLHNPRVFRLPIVKSQLKEERPNTFNSGPQKQRFVFSDFTTTFIDNYADM